LIQVLGHNESTRHMPAVYTSGDVDRVQAEEIRTLDGAAGVS
jgi:hypothetical protein